MIRILFQAIRYAPRLMWQAVFQPSKAYHFSRESEENAYIFILSFSFFGLLCGIVLAIPHYYLYKNILQSVFFAFAFAGAVAISGTFIGAVAILGAVTGAVAILGAVTGTGALVIIGSLAGSLAGVSYISGFESEEIGISIIECAGIFISIIGIFLFYVSISFFIVISLIAICWFVLQLDFSPRETIKLSEDKKAWLVIIGWILMLSAGGGIPLIHSYEMLIFSMSFFFGYFFNSQLNSIVIEEDGCLDHQYLGKAQKSSLIWCPLLAFLLYLFIIFNVDPGLHTKIIITAIGFAVMPIFILHIPDYLLCIPIWLFQKRKAVKHIKNPSAFIEIYENSILFKNEMLYFQLPGLHQFICMFAKTVEIEEAMKRIHYLDQFTFQQKQAQKALMALAKDKNTAHQYLHFLLLEKNVSLIKSLSKTVSLARLYLTLCGEKDKTLDKQSNRFSMLTLGISLFSRSRSEQDKENIPERLEEKIEFLCQEMAKEQGYRFNSEMVKSLEAAHKFLTSDKLKDINVAYNILESMGSFPVEITYFKNIELLFSQLKKIKEELPQIASVQRFVTRRDLLNRQKQHFQALSKMAEESFYEPFAEIWKEALKHFAEVIEKEINIQQGTATLDIELKNREIATSGEEQKLYFEIRNKGQEIAFDIATDLQADSPELSLFCGEATVAFDLIEADTSKEFSVSIIANTQITTQLRGFIRFSDRSGRDKTHPFAFPLIATEKEKVFREIENPYIAGNPLSGDTSLYFGRQDALDYINKNILVGEEHHTIVCYGLRRTGKTSLLNQITAQGFEDKRLMPVYMDIQGIGDEADFYITLWEKITEAVNGAEAECKDFGNFKRFLKKAENALGEKIIVILADEFEELQMRVESGKMPKDVFSNIRYLMQHEKKIVFLFCGTHKLEEMSKDYWSIFFNTALYLKINFLERKDMEKLVREPVAGELDYDSLAVEQIFKMTHGQPYLTQLICRSLVNDMNERKKRNYASINDVDDAVEKIIRQGDDHFSTHIWKDATTMERLILSATAEELTNKQSDSISFDGIYDKISLVGKYDKREIADTLGKLTSKDILTESNTGYSFPVNLFRLWVARKYPLRKVREEI